MNRTSNSKYTWAPGELFRALFDTYGPQYWWPGKTKFEIAIGAVLTQNTAWRNVERAIENLTEVGIINESSLLQGRINQLQELIRPAGFFIAKSKTLNDLCIWLQKNGSFSGLTNRATTELRKELLAINGVGDETADAILLYALERPIPVADAYTKRIAFRLGVLREDAHYTDCIVWLKTLAPLTVNAQNELHALIVSHGKVSCKKRNPLCLDCALRKKCPRIGIENSVPS